MERKGVEEMLQYLEFWERVEKLGALYSEVFAECMLNTDLSNEVKRNFWDSAPNSMKGETLRP